MKLSQEELDQKVKEVRRNYLREYRQTPAYKEKCKVYMKRYWEKKAAELN